MVLILSIAQDKSTNLVIDWLVNLGIPFVRINDDDYITINSISIGDSSDKIIFTTNNERHIVDLDKVSAFWYRRGDLRPGKIELKSRHLTVLTSGYLNSSWATIKQYLYHKLSQKAIVLGDFYKETQNNKLIDLHNAHKAGLIVPPTQISSDRLGLKSFFVRQQGCISKAIRNEFYKSDKARRIQFIGVGTFIVAEDFYEELDPYFHHPTLLQKNIEKYLEIRVFFLTDRLYSMAIFSQKNPQTSIDYRNYDKLNPNRTTPFLLPDEIRIKVQKFIKLSELQTGSIDLILTSNNDYYFLEVNPVGQFDWVARNCNYPIERDIAFFLSGKEIPDDNVEGIRN